MRRAFTRIPSPALGLAVGLAFAPVVTGQIVFQPPLTLETSLSTQGALAADVNLDGNVDLISVPDYAGVSFQSRFSVFLGDGDGGFAAPIDQDVVGDHAGRGAVALMDGDDFPDLVWVVHKGSPVASSFVYIYLGAGDGTFPTVKLVGLGPQNSDFADVVPVDVNADGQLDLVVLDRNNVIFFGTLRTWVANATGGYTQIASVTLAQGSQHFALGDVDGDGLPDAVVAAFGKILVAPALPGGGFGAPSANSAAATLSGLTLHDLNGDGSLDIAGTRTDGVVTLLGDGQGHFALQQTLALSGGCTDPAAASLDTDGVPDLLVSRKTQNEVDVLRGAGDGSFSFVTGVSNIPSAVGFAFADFDADGRLDAAVGQDLGNLEGQIAVLRNATYPAGSPFTDLGHALPGSDGYPIQLADGTLQAGTPVSFALANGLPLATSTLVLGFAQADLPFKGGVMVPAPALLIGGLPLDSSGTVTLVGLWPPGVPAGLQLYTQFWFADPTAPTHVAASTGLRVTTP